MIHKPTAAIEPYSEQCRPR